MRVPFVASAAFVLLVPFAAACSAAGVDDPGASKGDDASAPATGNDAGGAPREADASPPANPYDDAGTNGIDASAPPVPEGGCGAPSDCPGAGAPNAEVACTAQRCAFACKGESYDIDGDPKTGCETTDVPTGNHGETSATSLGSFSCNDGASKIMIDATLPSDQRDHVDPVILGFDPQAGAAPDWYTIHASGGGCEDDVNLDLRITSGTTLDCYRLTIVTDKATQTCDTDATGHCGIANGKGSYSDGSTILVSVKRSCTSPERQATSYEVTGHL